MNCRKEENQILDISKYESILHIVKIWTLKRIKLDPRGIKSVFVGYINNSNSYRQLELETNIIIESNNVKYFENSLSLNNELGKTHKEISNFSKIQDEISSYNVD